MADSLNNINKFNIPKFNNKSNFSTKYQEKTQDCSCQNSKIDYKRTNPNYPKSPLSCVYVPAGPGPKSNSGCMYMPLPKPKPIYTIAVGQKVCPNKEIKTRTPKVFVIV